MAWTAPRTWTDGELVTAAIMNPHVRDNLLAVGPHLIARKTSDQNFTTTTLADVTSLTLPVLANEVWKFEWQVIYSAPTAGDLKIAFTFPTAGRIDASVVWLIDDGATVGLNRWSGTTTPTTAQNFTGISTERESLFIQGIFTNSSTGGNLQMQAAQVAASGTTTIYTNSTVWAVKLA